MSTQQQASAGAKHCCGMLHPAGYIVRMHQQAAALSGSNADNPQLVWPTCHALRNTRRGLCCPNALADTRVHLARNTCPASLDTTETHCKCRCNVPKLTSEKVRGQLPRFRHCITPAQPNQSGGWGYPNNPHSQVHVPCTHNYKHHGGRGSCPNS